MSKKGWQPGIHGKMNLYITMCVVSYIFSSNRPTGPIRSSSRNVRAQLFQPLCEMLSYYNGNWFSSHPFVFRSSGKLKFGLNTHMI